MAGFELSDLALQSVMPGNKLITDDKEMPSIMVYIPKFQLKDVLNTDDTSVHPAFKINGTERDGFWVGKYQSMEGNNGRMYSLPGQNVKHTLGLDAFVSRSAAKGAGWHEITAAEWAALALWSKKNNTMPLGNNNYGKDTTESVYKAIPDNVDATHHAVRVKTGTGPVSWSHNHALDGVWDLNGNVNEWCTGFRLVKGEVQIIKDNDAADSSKDLSATSSLWKAIDATTGALIDPNGSGTTTNSVKLDYVSNTTWKYGITAPTYGTGGKGCTFGTVDCTADIGAAAKLLLRALAMLPDDGAQASDYSGDYFYADASADERCLSRGGYYINAGDAGVFYANLSYGRTGTRDLLGGRLAYSEALD